MKVAIASSGLGHITRGIETWACDTAKALQQHGIETTLFAAAPLPTSSVPTITLPCRKRNDRATRLITRLAPKWSWRWHLKSNYEIEQVSFWHYLEKHLRTEHFDILHVQDPLLAQLAQQSFAQKRIACRCILAHGTEEPPTYLRQFPYLQHLAPWHMQQTLQALGENAPQTVYPDWVMLPNFVDIDTFRPIASREVQAALRAAFQLPPEATIWGTAAAIKKHHKRIDWLLEEFCKAATQRSDLHLVIAGSKQTDTHALIQQAQERCPARVTFLVDLPHTKMADLFRTLDAFVLTSLFEMMPIALLEAISTGLPAYTHDHPVLDWMTGPGGTQIPMHTPNALRDVMIQSERAQLQRMGQNAREHAVNTFSIEAVIPAYIAYYRKISKVE